VPSDGIGNLEGSKPGMASGSNAEALTEIAPGVRVNNSP